MTLYIREARIEDREDCLAIAKMYPDTKTFAAPWYSGIELFVDSEEIYVIEQGGVAGFYAARFNRRDHMVNLAYIAVAAPGHGLGSELLDHLKWRVRLSGTHQAIKSIVGRRSLSFWRRQGFEIEDERRGVWSI